MAIAPSPKPAKSVVTPHGIPKVLTQYQRWLCWNYEYKNERWTKTPYSPLLDRRASSTNAATWCTFKEALSGYNRGDYDGIGLVPPSDMSGIDIDKCRNTETGELTPFAETIVAEMDTYTEVSPSGRGLRIFLIGNKPEGDCRDDSRGIEIYNGGGGRYFTVTGNALQVSETINERQSELSELHARLFPSVERHVVPRAPQVPSNLNDRDLIEKAKNAKNGWKFTCLWNGDWKGAGFESQSAADLSLCGALAFWTGGDASRVDSLFRQSGLYREKWERPDYSQKTIDEGISGCKGEFYNPQKPRTAPQAKANGETPSKISATPTEITQSELRPVIEVNGTPPGDVITESRQYIAIRNLNDPRIFWRDGRLERVAFLESGKPTILPLDEETLKAAALKSVCFVSTSNDRGAVEVLPPKFALLQILANSDEFSAFPPLDGTVTAPIFAMDGTLCTKQGYNPATRRYYHSPAPLVIPQMELAEARSLLIDDLLHDFPFADDASRAHAVALTLLPFVKNMIEDFCPLHLIDAPTPGSGKTLLANACALPFLSAPCSANTAPTEETEWRKEIFSLLSTAPSHALFDNVKGVLQSVMFESVITSEESQQRQLGTNTMASFKNVTIWMATSNNAEVGADLLRRSILIRIDTQTEDPSERGGFKHEPLLGWAKQNRGRLVGACLTIIQAWIDAGKPAFSGTTKLPSFEDWVRVMGGILEVAGISGFLENQDDKTNTIDPSRDSWRLFTKAWEQEFGADKVGAKDLFSLAKQYLEDQISAKDDDAMRKRFGRLLTKKRDVTYEDRKIMLAGKDRNGISTYYILNRSTVGLSEPTLTFTGTI